MNLESAIIQFLANEFKFEPEQISLDTNFYSDLNLSASEVSDLLQRLQDSLNFILPEDKVGDIATIGQLLSAAAPEE